MLNFGKPVLPRHIDAYQQHIDFLYEQRDSVALRSFCATLGELAIGEDEPQAGWLSDLIRLSSDSYEDLIAEVDC